MRMHLRRLHTASPDVRVAVRDAKHLNPQSAPCCEKLREAHHSRFTRSAREHRYTTQPDFESRESEGSDQREREGSRFTTTPGFEIVAMYPPPAQAPTVTKRCGCLPQFERVRGGLVFKAQRLRYHSTVGLRVITKRRRRSPTWKPIHDTLRHGSCGS